MNTTTKSLNLNVFCHPDRPGISQPFSEGDWTYYTDGKIILRVSRDHAVPEREDAPKNVDKAIFSEREPGFQQSLDKLKLPGLHGEEDCGNCEGLGTCHCKCGTDHDCGCCDGTGKTPEKPKGVDFSRHRLNHLLLHKLKQHLSNVLLLEYDENPRSSVGFTFDGGQGRLAPINPA